VHALKITQEDLSLKTRSVQIEGFFSVHDIGECGLWNESDVVATDEPKRKQTHKR
jgi:hypothetical protein